MNVVSTCMNAATMNWSRMPNFIKAATTTVATEFFLQYAAILAFQKTYSSKVRGVHKAAHLISGSVITGYFFREKHRSLFTFLKHPMALPYTIGLSVLPIFPCVERMLLHVCTRISNKCPDTGIIKKIESCLMKPLHDLDRTFRRIFRIDRHGIFSLDVWAPLSEELRYRLVLQRIFLREIPKLLLSFTTYKPEFVDHPISKTMRIGLSLYIFIQSHDKSLKQKISDSLISLQFAYLSESLGLGQAIVNHAANNLYVRISKSYHML